MKRIFTTIVLAVLFGAGTSYFVTQRILEKAGRETVTVATKNTGDRNVILSSDDFPDFTYSAETAVEAVVSVRVVKRSEGYVPSGILGLFFGYGQSVPREQIGSGSGVIITEDGYIVTNNHVVEGATEIDVTLNDNTVYPARMIGTDPATDVAVIKIDAESLPVLPFGDSDNLRLGEWVLAIGSPYELRSTITAGIVSAKGRTMPNYTGEFKIESFIQTDAAVNPGNSGGALVDKTGALVGVNTAIISQTGSYAGYSFAIPSNMVKSVAEDIMTHGYVPRAALGVYMQNFSEKNPDFLKLYQTNGVYISGVIPGGAADKGGVRRGDILIKIGDSTVKDTYSVREIVGGYRAGDEVTLTFVRKGEIVTRDIVFGSHFGARAR